MDNIGRIIKKFREDNNMTQDQLAEKMNVTRQAVSNWENSKTQPDIDTLFKLSQIFNVSVEEIIYGEKRNMVTNITNVTNQTVGNTAKQGIGFGVALAMVISYVKWHSIGWAIFHGLLNWGYVIYFVIKYGWNG
ncbi:MAG: helix-turn-helix transcriptional regulator [Oscillospiraceae bacterium]|nr:helix-turn-helix transcriptional regulator [Oscillospiraceae bacterium]